MQVGQVYLGKTKGIYYFTTTYPRAVMMKSHIWLQINCICPVLVSVQQFALVKSVCVWIHRKIKRFAICPIKADMNAIEYVRNHWRGDLSRGQLEALIQFEVSKGNSSVFISIKPRLLKICTCLKNDRIPYHQR